MAGTSTQLAESFERTLAVIAAVATNDPSQAQLLDALTRDPTGPIGATMWAGVLLRKLAKVTAGSAGMNPNDSAELEQVLCFIVAQLASETNELATVARFADGVSWPE